MKFSFHLVESCQLKCKRQDTDVTKVISSIAGNKNFSLSWHTEAFQFNTLDMYIPQKEFAIPHH